MRTRTTSPSLRFRPTLLAAALALASAGAWANVGRVDFVVGSVTAQQPNGASRALAKGGELYAGDRIVTADGRAQLRFADGAYVSLLPNTEFVIRDYKYDGKTDGSEKSVLGLLRGSIRAVTGLIGRINKAAYQIQTPTATLGIRGTGGIIEVLTDGSTRVTGTSGIWTVSNPAGTLEVPAGTAGLTTRDTSRPPQRTEAGTAAPPPPRASASGGTRSGGSGSTGGGTSSSNAGSDAGSGGSSASSGAASSTSTPTSAASAPAPGATAIAGTSPLASAAGAIAGGTGPLATTLAAPLPPTTTTTTAAQTAPPAAGSTTSAPPADIVFMVEGANSTITSGPKITGAVNPTVTVEATSYPANITANGIGVLFTGRPVVNGTLAGITADTGRIGDTLLWGRWNAPNLRFDDQASTYKDIPFITGKAAMDVPTSGPKGTFSLDSATQPVIAGAGMYAPNSVQSAKLDVDYATNAFLMSWKMQVGSGAGPTQNYAVDALVAGTLGGSPGTPTAARWFFTGIGSAQAKGCSSTDCSVTLPATTVPAHLSGMLAGTQSGGSAAGVVYRVDLPNGAAMGSIGMRRQ